MGNASPPPTHPVFMNYKFLFLVGSALNHFEEKNFSVYTAEERFLQTFNTTNRIDCLWKNYVSHPYESLVYGLHHHSQNIHLVCYNNLIQNPEQELQKIYEFLNLKPHHHDFNDILNSCAEDKDDAWGIENLHQIRKKLQKTSPSPEEIIGEENVNLYDKFNI